MTEGCTYHVWLAPQLTRFSLNLQLFVEEVIDVEERYDPYDRSIQLVPVVKQERGALRWLGDAIFNGIDNLREADVILVGYTATGACMAHLVQRG